MFLDTVQKTKADNLAQRNKIFTIPDTDPFPFCNHFLL